MAWITDEQLLAAVAARMSTTPAKATEMGPHLAVIITEAVESSYQFIRAVMIGRGYSAGQLENWDARVAWSKLVGCCHVFRALAVNKQSMPATDPVNGACKCEKDLETTPVLISGADAGYDGALPSGGAIANSEADCLLLSRIRRPMTDEEPCC